MQMGVEVVEVTEPFPTAGLSRVDSIETPPARLRGEGRYLALDPRLNATHRAVHEVLGSASGGRVVFSSAPIDAGDEEWPAGTPVVTGLPDLSRRAERWVHEWGIEAAALPELPDGRELRRLRVGLYRPWVASADEGWTRWVFERWGVPFDSLRDREVRGGGLRDRFDVIVVPDISYRDLMRGLDPARSPAAYAGGIGEEGALSLAEFVRSGGTLVLLDSSCEFAIQELRLPVRDVTQELTGNEAEQWYAPGSLLRVQWDTSHPLAAGMPDESAVFYSRSPVFEVDEGTSGVRVVGRYPPEDLLVSGYAQGEEQVAGKAALVEARLGEGRVVLFGFRPQHRAQTHETFKLLFNALYLR